MRARASAWKVPDDVVVIGPHGGYEVAWNLAQGRHDAIGRPRPESRPWARLRTATCGAASIPERGSVGLSR
jgi:hypothetical protein